MISLSPLRLLSCHWVTLVVTIKDMLDTSGQYRTSWHIHEATLSIDMSMSFHFYKMVDSVNL